MMDDPKIAAEFACVLLFDNKNRILLLERSNTGWFDGYWGLPGGRVEKDESAAGAAAREAREEVGVVISERDLILLHTAIIKHAGRSHRGYYLTARIWDGQPSVLEPEKCTAVDWFAVTELPEAIIPSSRHVIECKGCDPDITFES